jgi:hypothetical protein
MYTMWLITYVLVANPAVLNFATPINVGTFDSLDHCNQAAATGVHFTSVNVNNGASDVRIGLLCIQTAPDTSK